MNLSPDGFKADESKSNPMVIGFLFGYFTGKIRTEKKVGKLK